MTTTTVTNLITLRSCTHCSKCAFLHCPHKCLSHKVSHPLCDPSLIVLPNSVSIKGVTPTHQIKNGFSIWTHKVYQNLTKVTVHVGTVTLGVNLWHNTQAWPPIITKCFRYWILLSLSEQHSTEFWEVNRMELRSVGWIVKALVHVARKRLRIDHRGEVVSGHSSYKTLKDTVTASE